MNVVFPGGEAAFLFSGTVRASLFFEVANFEPSSDSGSGLMVAEGNQAADRCRERKKRSRIGSRDASRIRISFSSGPVGISSVQAICGRVDMATQRVAFDIRERNNLTLECGLTNLTGAELRVLAHLPGSHR